jgi:predicted nucleotidyltransferase
MMKYKGAIRPHKKNVPDLSAHKAPKAPESFEDLPDKIRRTMQNVSALTGVDVYLHGSWAKGTQHSKSDIDLLIFGVDPKRARHIKTAVRGINSNVDLWILRDKETKERFENKRELICFKRQ